MSFAMLVCAFVKDAGWAYFLKKSTKIIDLKDMQAYHYEGSKVDIFDAPHYAFFSEYRRTGKRPLCSGYEEYMVAQYGFSQEKLEERIDKSLNLYDVYAKERGGAEFRPLVVDGNNGKFFIVDGFHRVSIMAAQGDRKIMCHIVFKTPIRKEIFLKSRLVHIFRLMKSRKIK